MNTPLNAQKLFTFDEMLSLSQCKTLDAFEKIVLSNHYSIQPAQRLPPNLREMYTYTDKKNPATGTYNSAAWLVVKGTGRDYRYVNFSFTNNEHFNELSKLLKQRGYVYLKSNGGDMGKGVKALVDYLRNGKTGIVISATDDPSTNIVTCEIAITTITTPRWPDDEK